MSLISNESIDRTSPVIHELFIDAGRSGGRDVPMSTSKVDLESTALAYLDLWNERRLDLIPDIVSESFVMYDPFAPEDDIPGPKGEVHGRCGLESFIEGVVEGFPDFHVEVTTICATENRVLYDGILRMTHTGPFFGIPPTGNGAETMYMGVIQISDGLIESHRTFPPVLDIGRQLRPKGFGMARYAPRFTFAMLRSRF